MLAILVSKEAKSFEHTCMAHFPNNERLISCIDEEKETLVKMHKRLKLQASLIETTIVHQIKDLDSEMHHLKEGH